MSVIRPVPTQWTTYYLAYSRLLNLRHTLENVVKDDAARAPVDCHIIQPQHEHSTLEKASRMVEIIKDNQF